MSEQPVSHIILCGMPGSGKTTVGKRIADKKGVDFYDLDDLVENRAQMTISRFFFLHGEEEFRKAEQTVLNEFLNNHKDESWVLSLGGGTPAFFNNLDLVLENGNLYFLDAPINTLVDRLKKQNPKRPLLQENPAKKLEELLQQRLPFFEKAIQKVRTNDSPERIASYIISRENKNQQPPAIENKPE